MRFAAVFNSLFDDLVEDLLLSESDNESSFPPERPFSPSFVFAGLWGGSPHRWSWFLGLHTGHLKSLASSASLLLGAFLLLSFAISSWIICLKQRAWKAWFS